MPSDTIKTNLRTLLFVLIVLPLLLVFGIGMVTNGDPLWFMSTFDETPARIVLYRNGCQTELVAGQPGFAELNEEVNRSLSNLSGFWATYGLSADSLKYYRTQASAVELIYGKPVTVHAPYRFGHPDKLFIGLSEQLGQDRALFGGHADQYWAGAIRLKSIQGIQQAAENISCTGS